MFSFPSNHNTMESFSNLAMGINSNKSLVPWWTYIIDICISTRSPNNISELESLLISMTYVDLLISNSTRISSLKGAPSTTHRSRQHLKSTENRFVYSELGITLDIYLKVALTFYAHFKVIQWHSGKIDVKYDIFSCLTFNLIPLSCYSNLTQIL